ncbi:hypothetical protein ACJIZ3_007847 [Penstemon smallii]|uniref:Uncharacterized protein n=1 Tax=Penstemon smallii TaxID=265156 RepID=A0ABD3T907_9LAMI
MKGMPLPFDFQGKGLFLQLYKKKNLKSSDCLLNKKLILNSSFEEPKSVLDSTSSSTLSSSLGGGGGGSTDTAGVAAVSETSSSNAAGGDSVLLNLGISDDKCVMEDWETVLSETASSPSQEQSILRWIMGGDVEDPSMSTASINKVLQSNGGAAAELDFNGGGGDVDQFGADFIPNFTNGNRSDSISNPIFPNLPNNFNNLEPVFNPTIQNPSFLQEHNYNPFIPPPAKRHNPNGSFSDTGQETYPTQLHMLPHYLHQKPKIGYADELGLGHANHHHHQQQQQQGIIDQLYKAAESIQTGNLILAQGILARLNHQLSPIGKPFCRAAFYYKEALLQLLLDTTNISSNTSSTVMVTNTPFSLVFKIGAYKCFSEVSPLVQFGNFTCNQTLLEAFEGYERVHIVDFDIGYGGQWASLMQELALRNGGEGPSMLKITALASPSTHDRLELGLTQENLVQFASEVNIGFEFDVLNVDSLNSCSWSTPIHASEKEAIAVNLPVGSLASYHVSVPLVLRFVKQLSPRIIVSTDRGCHRTDLPFANHVIHALQSYSNLVESLDSVNMNMDSMQKIERFLLQPEIEKIVIGRFKSPEKTQHWRSLFLSSGFSPVTFSHFTESQAECVVKRTPIRGFQVEKRQSSLVLCWQRKELISVSAWRC